MGGSAGRKKKSKQTSKNGPSTERRGRWDKKKKNARTKLPSPITQETLQTLTLKIANNLEEPQEKDEDLKTYKAPGISQGENADRKTQKRPEATQGENAEPKTQKRPGATQGKTSNPNTQKLL